MFCGLPWRSGLSREGRHNVLLWGLCLQVMGVSVPHQLALRVHSSAQWLPKFHPHSFPEGIWCTAWNMLHSRKCMWIWVSQGFSGRWRLLQSKGRSHERKKHFSKPAVGVMVEEQFSEFSRRVGWFCTKNFQFCVLAVLLWLFVKAYNVAMDKTLFHQKCHIISFNSSWVLNCFLIHKWYWSFAGACM